MEKGIVKLKEVINLIGLIQEKGLILKNKVNSGKRINGWDSLKFIKPLFTTIGLIGEYKEIGKEWIDLDEEEKSNLNTHVRNSLKLGSTEKDIELAERIIYLGFEIGDLITELILQR